MNITVSLETAKKMKENGRKKETYFSYAGLNDPDAVIEYIRVPTKKEKKENPDTYLVYDRVWMPTAQEILDELPTVIESGRIEYMLTMTKKSALYLDVDIGDNCHSRSTLIVFDGDNLAESLAELRLRCKQNDYLSS